MSYSKTKILAAIAAKIPRFFNHYKKNCIVWWIISLQSLVSEVKLGYGLGGVSGNKLLANHLVDRVNDEAFIQYYCDLSIKFKVRMPKPAKSDVGAADAVEEPPKKKGKVKDHYGKIS